MCPKKLGDPWTHGCRIHIVRLADLADVSLSHDGDHVGNGECLGLIMGNEDRRDTGSLEDLAEFSTHSLSLWGIQIRERLVE